MLRPSSLPKLKHCPRWESDGDDVGEAANRGTALDVAFRKTLSGELLTEDELQALTDEDAVALDWAVKMALHLADGSPIEAREEHLRIEWEGIKGTQDALCSGKDWSADLKSGQIRNYYEQQAAYALGNMDAHFTSEWTVHLLFCDEQKVITLKYTYEQAAATVRRIRAAYHDPLSVATPCEYCSWCSKRWTCEPRLAEVAWYYGEDPRTFDLTSCKGDPAKLANMLNLAHNMGDVLDTLKEWGMEYMMKGTDVPGWHIQSGRTLRNVSCGMLQHGVAMADGKGGKFSKTVMDMLGSVKVFNALGNMSEKAFLALWNEAFPGRELPDGTVRVSHGSSYAKRGTAKPKKEKAASA